MIALPGRRLIGSVAALSIAVFAAPTPCGAQLQQPAAHTETPSAAPLALAADFEVSDPLGRRIVVRTDGTWRFADPQSGRPQAQAELALVRMVPASSSSCSLELSLTNRLPYEVRSIVLDFSVLRADGVVYSSSNTGFTALRPGDVRQRTLGFDGIACREIAAVRVWGGDRCEMDDLTRFSDANGACLARIRVLPNAAVKFEK